jgi:hypothetical protein
LFEGDGGGGLDVFVPDDRACFGSTKISSCSIRYFLFFPLQVIDVRVCRSGVSDAEASLRKPADDQFKILLAHLVLVLFFYYLVLSA